MPSSSLGWKFQSKFAELARFGANRDSAVTFLHNPIANTQAQTHPLSDIFSGKKWVEDFIQMFVFDPKPIVANGQNTPAWFDPAFDQNGGFFVLKFLVL